MPISTVDVLTKALAGDSISASDIDALVTQQVAEDQHLEYKDGQILTSRNRPCEVVRRYLAGFANADGGVLLVGIDEANWSVSNARAPGGHALDRWAKDCVVDLAGYFSPLPRFQVVNHPDGEILVAAAGRSVNLVPDIRGREIIYHLRIHDSTVEVPEYLMTDLVLGRRQHPVLRISDYHFTEVSKRRPEPDYVLDVTLAFQTEIDSLAWAEDFRMGLIAYSHLDSNPRPISKHLTVHLNTVPVDQNHFPFQYGLVHHEIGQTTTVQGPFTVAHFRMPNTKSFAIPLSQHNEFSVPYVWQGAAYLISRNSPPFWYQINITINSDLLQAGGRDALNARKDEFLEVNPVETDRPVIAWTPQE